MKPYYLRFPDWITAMETMESCGFVRRLTTAEQKTIPGPYISADPGLCIIGESWRNDGQHEMRDGKMVTTRAATKRSGYFVNWIGEELPEVLKPYATQPATPFQVFWGWSPEDIAAREAAKEPPEQTEGAA